MNQTKSALARMLPRGAVKEIAEKLGVTPGAITRALHNARPTHPAVAEALRIVEESGVVQRAEVLANLTG